MSEISPSKFAEIFVKGAQVSVFDGDKEVFLIPLCLNDLPEELKKMVAEALNLNIENLTADICIYADILNQITREQGRTYSLKVLAEGKTLTAVTTIPFYVPFTDFKWGEPPGTPRATLARLITVSYTPLPAPQTVLHLVCRLLLDKKHNYNFNILLLHSHLQLTHPLI